MDMRSAFDAEADIRTGGMEVLGGDTDDLKAGMVVLTGRPPGSPDPQTMLRTAGDHLDAGGHLMVLAQAPEEKRSRFHGFGEAFTSEPEPYNLAAVESLLQQEGFQNVQQNPVADSRALWIRAIKA